MLAHLVDDFVAERDKKELRAFASGEFHRRDKISIPSHENNHIDLLLQRQRRNVETNTHVDTLLADVRNQILRGELNFGFVGGQLMRVQSPTPESEVSHSQSNEGYIPQISVQALIVSSKVRVTERNSSAGERLALG